MNDAWDVLYRGGATLSLWWLWIFVFIEHRDDAVLLLCMGVVALIPTTIGAVGTFVSWVRSNGRPMSPHIRWAKRHEPGLEPEGLAPPAAPLTVWHRPPKEPQS